MSNPACRAPLRRILAADGRAPAPRRRTLRRRRRTASDVHSRIRNRRRGSAQSRDSPRTSPGVTRGGAIRSHGTRRRPRLQRCRASGREAPSQSRDFSDAQARGAAPRGGRAVLADQDARSHDPVRVGEPVRRLRPVLPDEARGRGYRRGPPHRYRLHAARRPDLPVPRLRKAAEARARLRAPDARGGAVDRVAAADLRVPARARRAAALPVAPLVSGRAASVHEAGISVRGRLSGNEEEFSEDELPDRIVDWPGLDPSAA